MPVVTPGKHFIRPVWRHPVSVALAWLLFLSILQTALCADEPLRRTDSSLLPAKKSYLLIEPMELERSLQRKRLRIVDTRSKDQYSKGHIPGAVLVNVESWKELGKSEGGFQNVKAWAEKVRQLGIDANSQVVMYGSRLSDTARIWWTLKYLGLKDVMILDGGWSVWVETNRPTSTEMPRIVATEFVPELQTDRLEEIDTLKKSLRTGKVTVVDTRSDDEFTGKDVRGTRGGRIPGATHLEWKELLTADGRFKTREQLQELFRQRGILPDETTVCY